MKNIYVLLFVVVLFVVFVVYVVILVDLVNDFILIYIGLYGGDLDVISSFVSYNLFIDMFIFFGMMNVVMGMMLGSFYVWGVDCGVGMVGFVILGMGYLNILFDIVVILCVDGIGIVVGMFLFVGIV